MPKKLDQKRSRTISTISTWVSRQNLLGHFEKSRITSLLTTPIVCRSGALRFRTAQHPVRSENVGSDETGQARGGGSHYCDASFERHELVQACE